MATFSIFWVTLSFETVFGNQVTWLSQSAQPYWKDKETITILDTAELTLGCIHANSYIHHGSRGAGLHLTDSSRLAIQDDNFLSCRDACDVTWRHCSPSSWIRHLGLYYFGRKSENDRKWEEINPKSQWNVIVQLCKRKKKKLNAIFLWRWYF